MKLSNVPNTVMDMAQMSHPICHTVGCLTNLALLGIFSFRASYKDQYYRTLISTYTTPTQGAKAVPSDISELLDQNWKGKVAFNLALASIATFTCLAANNPFLAITTTTFSILAMQLYSYTIDNTLEKKPLEGLTPQYAQLNNAPGDGPITLGYLVTLDKQLSPEITR